MGDVLRFESDFGPVYIEERDDGLERVGLISRARPAAQRLDAALAQVRPAFQAAIQALDGLTQAPAEFEIEVGLTLTAEAGAIIARTATEGHVIVRATWRPPRGGKAGDGEAAAGDLDTKAVDA